jgi:ParB-like chromosome segregation protein Spo0J
MATTSIPFDEIAFHPDIVNPREELRDIDELEASIRAVGLQVPLTVLHQENKRPQNGEKRNKYFLVVGFRRHEALKRIREGDENAFRSVEVKRFKGSIIEAQVLNLTENIQRCELTPLEIANGVEILFNLGYKQ